jgi:hypothetical protein
MGIEEKNPVCPRKDCELELRRSDFLPPDAWECPDHGGPITFSIELDLMNDEVGSPMNDLDHMISCLSRLAKSGLLYTTDYDIGGLAPTIVTIENMSPDNIDVRFEFDPETKRLMAIKSYVDKRKVPTF